MGGEAGEVLAAPEKAGNVFWLEEPSGWKKAVGAGGGEASGAPFPVWGFSLPRWEVALNAATEQPGVGPRG